jgi:hypothetical protein
MAKFLPENKLEILFLDAFADASRRPAFYRAFIEGTVMVMDDDPPADGAARPAARPPSVQLLEINGTPHVPVFTSPSRISAYTQRGGRCHQVGARALLESMRNLPFIVNPGSSPCKVFTREEVVALLDGTLLAAAGKEEGGSRKAEG